VDGKKKLIFDTSSVNALVGGVDIVDIDMLTDALQEFTR